MKKKKVKEIGITALYERLSRDDDGDGDSNSIVHQKQMLEAYAKEHGFVNLRHYTDDGWSGASFDRPAWNELVAGVKAEEITTVIVKDLSRVGRDHLQVGFFTDILFREKEVHFIAIGNGIDSNDQQSSEFAPFLNIMNEWYVRDTDFSELTPAMVNEFVSKIIVHRPFELNGTRAVQVEVYLNYIGKFDVPEEPMILSEEELATQKIREEKLEKHRIASRKYMAKYRKRLKEMKKAGTILPENLPAETKGEWLCKTAPSFVAHRTSYSKRIRNIGST